MTVIASFFLKKIAKDAASITFPSELEMVLDLPTTDIPPKRFKQVVPLFGRVKPDECKFKVLGTKLEVTLAKADGASWPVLRGDERTTGEIIQVGRAEMV